VLRARQNIQQRQIFNLSKQVIGGCWNKFNFAWHRQNSHSNGLLTAINLTIQPAIYLRLYELKVPD
jgi:hypothetical protein